MFIIFSVFYILVAAAMIVLILMQRGQGASAGASFGGGSSGTVFGASGSANFLGRATGALALLFFLLSLGMAIYLAHSGAPQPVDNLGVMSGVTTDSANQTSADSDKAASGQSATEVPTAAPAGDVPTAQDSGKGAGAADADVPTATKSSKDDAGASKTGKDTGKPEPNKN